ncbi:MAG: TolC family protein [Clostridium butyricum]|nr:TolC family protein [Clostridium butyricum]
MGKNLNKIIAFAIAISVISGSTIPAMAAEKKVKILDEISTGVVTNKPLLTVEKAMESAISNSETLALLDKTISYNKKINNIQEMDDNITDYNKDINDLSIKQLKQKRDYEEDILKAKVKKAYNELVISELDLDNMRLQLDSINKKYSDIKLKNKLGLITKLDTSEFELNVRKLKDGIQSAESALKVAQYSFNNLTGLNVENYKLSEDIEYDKFEIDGCVDDYLDEIVEDYIEASLKQKMIDKNKEHLDDIKNDVKVTKDDKPDKKDYNKAIEDKDGNIVGFKFDENNYNNALSAYNTKLKIYITYLGDRLSNISNQTTLNETKKLFKEALRQYYATLINQENIIEMDKSNFELNNQKLKNFKLQYDLGQITKNAYDDKVIECQKLKLQIRKDIKAYNEYKEQIQKPWISLTIK